ncbi:AMIN domain-containing protein [Leptolyngbya iicbica LK]|uniref:AMIN domain-containing protein n=3 Tax=Cyanophyceae TaxID=3028117 RepID=A0A4Q7E6Y8_9CYAN|nr:AMIN domain-containing protein [Leptolyngbya sp. LK]
MAASTVITGVEIVPTDGGAQIVLATAEGDTPQVFAVNQGNTLRADIVRTQLQLPEGDRFVQQNPAPGIAEIAIVPLDDNSVRLMVSGNGSVPTSVVGTSANGGVIIDVATNGSGSAPQASTPVPSNIETVPSDEPVLIPVEQPDTVAQAETAEPTEEATPAPPQPDVLVPNPQVVIDGVPVDAPAVQTAPPFLPSAVAPPVGDIAVSETVPSFGSVDLGTTERVPRLVLRDAPSREVLNLLARAAGLNLVFIDAGGGEGEGASAGSGEGPPITLDIENESVQDVFNSVLRVTGLQANRVGRTIYVGTSLPNSARNIVMRTLRLNQIDAPQASNFLVGLGAERAVSREREVQTVSAIDVEQGLSETEVETTTEEVVETSRADFQDSIPIFRGLQVIAEERTNSITLVGSPELVQLATAQLVRLDLRRRQVAINLKVIDVDLNAIDAFGTSFSFSAGDADLIQAGGVGVINFGAGSRSPATPSALPNSPPIGPQSPLGNGLFSIVDDFIFQLQATVSEGNAKILTDPTLIVQEGQTASVELTQDVPTDVETTIETTDSGTNTSVNVTFEPAGLILQVDVDRIDDNGFVTLSVAPSITSPTDTFTINSAGFSNTVFLLNNRQLQSGSVRVRDGQTLVLSGIIQETERSSVSKIPILGDIPILGSLFRSTVNDNQRQELIVLLTPEILDDTDQSAFGYSYTPSDEVQEIIERSRQR